MVMFTSLVKAHFTLRCLIHKNLVKDLSCSRRLSVHADALKSAEFNPSEFFYLWQVKVYSFQTAYNKCMQSTMRIFTLYTDYCNNKKIYIKVLTIQFSKGTANLM